MKTIKHLTLAALLVGLSMSACASEDDFRDASDPCIINGGSLIFDEDGRVDMPGCEDAAGCELDADITGEVTIISPAGVTVCGELIRDPEITMSLDELEHYDGCEVAPLTARAEHLGCDPSIMCCGEARKIRVKVPPTHASTGY